MEKKLKSIMSGAGTGDIYQPTLWCYELLKFLDMGNPVIESQYNLDEGVSTELENPSAETRPGGTGEVIFEGDIQQLNNANISVDDDFEKEETIDAFSQEFEEIEGLLSPASRPSTRHILGMEVVVRKCKKSSSTRTQNDEEAVSLKMKKLHMH